MRGEESGRRSRGERGGEGGVASGYVARRAAWMLVVLTGGGGEELLLGRHSFGLMVPIVSSSLDPQRRASQCYR